MPSASHRTMGSALRALAALALWVLAGGDAAAQALGRPEGDPLLGRPLRLGVPILADAAEASACIQATLQQGDTAPVPLQWTLEPASSGAWRIRLQSDEAVREPVITVTIALGCARQFTRGYVLLAEPPRANEPSQPVSEAPAQRPAVPLVAAAAAEPPARPPEALVAAAPPAARAPAAPRQAGTSQERAPRPTSQPRLRVELFDAQVDQAPALRLTMSLAKPPAAEDPRRAEAAAAWQAARQAPEAAAAQALQAPVRQAQAQGLRDLQGRQEAAGGILSESLARAVAQRDQMLAGAAALVVCLGALVWFGRRSRRAARAREEAAAHPAPMAGDASAFDASQMDAPVPAVAAVRAVPAAPAARAAPQDPRPGGGPVASADELLDIQQKADFFVAVGRMDEAITLLEAQLDEPMGGLPYLWLDVLDLCRRAARSEDYERIRKRFQRRFSAHLPAFDAARPEEGGLARYPRVLSRIEILWPSAKAMSVVEAALFEEPAPGGIPFDLEASRELLMLYGVLLELQTEAQMQPDFTPTMEAPLMGRARPSSTEPIPLSVLAALDEEAEGRASGPPPDEHDDLDLDFSLATNPGPIERRPHA